jgi:F-type H+-transporting ATPase subunit gamma
MASLKSIRKRIGSVKNTQQITKAMKMVAAAKLRRAQEAAQAARPYAEKLADLLQTVAARAGDVTHPLLATREHEQTIDVIVVTSDRGLCGGYNSNLVRAAERMIAQHSGAVVRVTAIGNKATSYFRKRPAGVAEQHAHLAGGPDHALAAQIAARVSRDFADGTTDGVYLVYSHFRSAISQVPTVQQILPVAASPTAGDTVQLDYIYEPDPATLLDRLLRQYVTTVIDHAFLESIASEHGARMTAMENATANANEMIDRLTLAMNRARQAAITTELMEIVSGAEALKG